MCRFILPSPSSRVSSIFSVKEGFLCEPDMARTVGVFVLEIFIHLLFGFFIISDFCYKHIVFILFWENFFIKFNIYLKANTKIWRIYIANKTSYMNHLISNIIQKLTSTNQLMNLNALWNSIFISSGMVKPILIEAEDSPAG